jgi:hypothetical protein
MLTTIVASVSSLDANRLNALPASVRTALHLRRNASGWLTAAVMISAVILNHRERRSVGSGINREVPSELRGLRVLFVYNKCIDGRMATFLYLTSTWSPFN